MLTGTLVMTEFNPSTMVWMTGLGYLGGPSAVVLAGIFVAGLGLYTVLVAKRWKRLNVTSLAELFELRYHRGLRLAASLMILFALSLFSVGYLKATAMVLMGRGAGAFHLGVSGKSSAFEHSTAATKRAKALTLTGHVSHARPDEMPLGRGDWSSCRLAVWMRSSRR